MKTIDKSQTKNETGAIGIGAMIVFIALILVAAVASAVIIQTAEKLQQTAQQTGSDTESEQGTKISVLSAVISAADTVLITYELGPGSAQVADTAVSWMTTHDGGADICIEGADFSASTTLAGGAVTTLIPGTAYELALDLTTCSIATTTSYTLLIGVSGGGNTLEILTTGLSVAAGQVVV
ncbi:MAG: hypothetical protein QGF72_01500 [Candidatus Poseidoniaceae archaeon]|nr:hypothetical protein [Candidatus Poseidoniaceae archaeon]